MSKNNSTSITYTTPSNAAELSERFSPTILSEKDQYNIEKCNKEADDLASLLDLFAPIKDADYLEATATKILEAHHEVLPLIKTLAGVSGKEKYFKHEDGCVLVNFDEFTNPPSDYVRVLSEGGILDAIKMLFNKPTVGGLRLFLMGKDTNARKNRSGKIFEDEVELHIVGAGFAKAQSLADMTNMTYVNQAKTKDIAETFDIDFSCFGEAPKKFDHFLMIDGHMVGVEDSCYTASGSKPNEVARSYQTLGREAKSLKNFTLAHIVDGYGWKSSLKNLADEMTEVEHVWCIADFENGALQYLVDEIKANAESDD